MKGQFAWKCGAPTIVDANSVPCRGSMEVNFHCALCPHCLDSDNFTPNYKPTSEILLHQDIEDTEESSDYSK